eukprot:4948382-Prymnesium_polylepis.1
MSCSNGCTAMADPNNETGVGYLVYVPACVLGGYGCVEFTGCKHCNTMPPYTYAQCPPCILE